MRRTAGAGRWLACGDPLDLGVHLASAGASALLLRDGLQEQRAPHRLLRAGPQLLEELRIVPGELVRVHALAPQPLARVLDLVADLAQDQGLRHLERVPPRSGSATASSRAARFSRSRRACSSLRDLGAQRLQRLEGAHGLGEVVVERGEHLLLHLLHRHRGLAGLAAQGLGAVVVGEAQPRLVRVPPATRPITASSISGMHLRLAEDEPYRYSVRGSMPSGVERVVDDHEVAEVGGALDGAELRVLLAELVIASSTSSSVRGLGSWFTARPA